MIIKLVVKLAFKDISREIIKAKINFKLGFMATPPHILAAGPQKQACNRKIELIRLSDG